MRRLVVAAIVGGNLLLGVPAGAVKHPGLAQEVRTAYREAAHCGGYVVVRPLYDGTAKLDQIGRHSVTVEGCDQ